MIFRFSICVFFIFHGQNAVDRIDFREEQPYTFLSPNMYPLTHIFSFWILYFSKFVDFVKNDTFVNSREVLQDEFWSTWKFFQRKVFIIRYISWYYISCHHISHQSKVTSYFLQKISRLTRYNLPFHLCSNSFFFQPIRFSVYWER